MEPTLKYQAKINRTDRNNSHSLAVEFIQAIRPTGLKILEVGCASGYLGAHLKELGHHVTGVELDTESAQLARQVLDEVHCTSIERFYEDHAERKFDIICFGDVLEHLLDPKDVLKRSILQLSPDGHIICSVPNIAHGITRGSLFEGNWDYADLGIMDRTHLRFFTKKTFIDLLLSSSLTINKLQATKASIEKVGRQFGIDLSPETKSLLKSKIRADSTLEDFQYVACASVAHSQNLTKNPELASRHPLRILALCENPTLSIAKIRITLPLTEYSDAACRELKIKSFSEAEIRDLFWSDVVVVQRGIREKPSKLIRNARKMGKPVIYEIDDLLTELPDFLGHHTDCLDNQSLIEKNIRAATLVTVTNARLKAALMHLNANIAICPNYANPMDLAASPLTAHTATGIIHIFIAASDKIKIDFITPALKVIQEKYGDRIAIHSVGPISEKIIESGINCTPHKVLDHHEFIPFLKQQSNGIGVIPLDDSKFSSCKSAVKYFDYTQAGLVVACSNVSPYQDVITDDDTGLLSENTTEAWVQTLSRAIEDHGLRRRLVTNAQQEVAQHHNLAQTVAAWGQAFDQVAPISQVKPLTTMPALFRMQLGLDRLKDKASEINRQRKTKRAQKKAPSA